MSIEKKIVAEELVPFSELPFTQLTEDERKKVCPMALVVKQKALGLLGSNIDATFKNGIYIMGKRFCDQTCYIGADVLIERWHVVEEGEREFSIAFYPDKVINRPNYSGRSKVVYSDGTSEFFDWDAQSNHEVGYNELNNVLILMQGCIKEALEESSRLSKYLAIQFSLEDQQKQPKEKIVLC